MTEYFEHRWLNSNTIQKRSYQENIVKTCLEDNTLVVLPTGLGKTPLAALVTAYRLDQDMYKKILFMAPTKPLVNQHKKSFEKFLKIGPDELKVVTGETKKDQRKEMYENSDVVFATPQTIRNDLKKGILDLSDFSLLIVDEAHRAIGSYSYTYVAKKYIDQSKTPLLLALTASPGSSSKVNEIKQALFIKNIEVRTKEDEDVTGYVKDVDLKWIKVELTKPMQTIRNYLDDMKQERMNTLKKWGFIRSTNVSKSFLLKLQKEIPKRRSGAGYAAMSLIAEIIKLDHAIGLLETQSLYSTKKYFDKIIKEGTNQDTKAAERLINDKRFMSASHLLLDLINENEEHPKIKKLREIMKDSKNEKIIIFTQYRDNVEKLKKVVSEIEGMKPVTLIGQSGSSGLKQSEQVKIIKEFDLGFHNCLICTSIGEEGLHIGSATTAIFYEPIPSAVRTVQRRGRVGREKTGKLYVLMTKDTRDEAYYWSAYHKEKKMTDVLKRMKNRSLDEVLK